MEILQRERIPIEQAGQCKHITATGYTTRDCCSQGQRKCRLLKTRWEQYLTAYTGVISRRRTCGGHNGLETGPEPRKGQCNLTTWVLLGKVHVFPPLFPRGYPLTMRKVTSSWVLQTTLPQQHACMARGFYHREKSVGKVLGAHLLLWVGTFAPPYQRLLDSNCPGSVFTGQFFWESLLSLWTR